MATQVTIAEDGNLLTIDIENTVSSSASTNFSIRKEDVVLHRTVDQFDIQAEGITECTFRFSDVVSPVAANAPALEVLIENMLKNVSPPAPVGTQDVNITEVGGNAVTTFVPVQVTAALPAGENHTGSMGGNTNIVSSTITMSVAGAYASGDYMGTTTTPQAFTNAMRVSGGTGVVKSITISDKITTANVAMELWLFSATFVAPTDNAAWAISDAENLTVLGVIPIGTSLWFASSNNQVYNDNTLSIPVKSATRDIFYALVARGVTPAFTSQDLTVTLGILQD